MSATPPWAGVVEPEYITRIRILFYESLDERVRKIEESLAILLEGEEERAYPAARALFMEAHRIAGSAESFGGQRLGDISGRIDHELRSYYDDEILPPSEVVLGIVPLVEELQNAEKEFLQWMEWDEVNRSNEPSGLEEKER